MTGKPKASNHEYSPNWGGSDRGQGRKPSPFISKKVTLHFETEQEYQSLLERIKDPRQRTLILMAWIENEPSKPQVIY